MWLGILLSLLVVSSAALEPCVGVDIGSTNSVAAVVIEVLGGTSRQDVVVAKMEPKGKAKTGTSVPSVVAFVEKESDGKKLKYDVVVGDDAKKQQLENLANTVAGFKRLIGRSYGKSGSKDNSHPDLVEDNQHHDFAVASDPKGAPRVVLLGGSKSDHKTPNAVGALTVTSGPSDPSSSLTVPHLYAEVLKYMVNEVGAGELTRASKAKAPVKVQNVVVTVPASYGDNGKQAVKDAATIAGLTVVKVLTEPVAACLGYGFTSESSDRTILVVHVGGASVEASLVSLNEGFFELDRSKSNHSIAQGGPAGLGLDALLLNHILAQAEKKADPSNLGEADEKWGDIRSNKRAVNRIRKTLEAVKKMLSSKPKSRIDLKGILAQSGGEGAGDLDVKITREEFEGLLLGGGDGTSSSSIIEDGILKTIRSLLDIKPSKRDSGRKFDEVILVGGSSNVPAVKHAIRNDKDLMRLWSGNKNNKKSPRPIEIAKGLKPEEVVAYGAAHQCKMSMAKQEAGDE